MLKHTSTVTRFLISCLTILTLILVWWYSELERRLLVVRHHLCREMNLLCSPLAGQFILEGTIEISKFASYFSLILDDSNPSWLI